MTDNEIIKALECCIKNDIAQCKICAYDKFEQGCRRKLEPDILDLINRQKAEIERDKSGMMANAEVVKAVTNELKTAKSEVIKEFAEKVDELLKRYSLIHEIAEIAMQDVIECEDGTTVEMQSVWDVHTLIKNEMSEYEEMYRLQDNIENIAKERLLKEIEKDLRLLIKEMAEES